MASPSGPSVQASPSDAAPAAGVRLGAGAFGAPGLTQGVGAPLPGCADAIPYPPDERRRGVTGAVNLRLRIRDNGGVVEARVIESSGSTGLDEAAVQGIRRCRFAPAVRDGINVFGTREYRVVFRLE
ncbi:energy transducer TonB [Roseomonas sp. CCTCC AB2023176]|uniref:energy transducer TonB n=1 Tax=Roseomonas sp. CCTCC AB2023176 TaxID=3342640 RepID=UPI0035D9A2C7